MPIICIKEDFKMKILQVTPYFPPAYAFGGPVKVTYQISRELIKRGHEVVVYTTDVKDFGSRLEIGSSNTFEGMKVYRFRNLSLTFVKKFKLFITPQLALFARKEVKKFDIIHLHEYRTFQNIVIHHYARKYNVPYVLQAHGSIPRIGSWRKLKWIYDILFGYRLLRDASRVIALSNVEAEQYKCVGVPGEKIAIIPNGIDLSEYAELPPKGSFKKKFNIPENRKIILYLGRIHKIKGIDVLVKAYAHLKNEMKVNDTVLVVTGPDDGFLNEVKSLAYNLGIADSVLFTGPLYGRDKLEAFVDTEIYVLPSRYEIFGMTVLEAYACGKPIVASKVGGLKDLVKDGETGLLFEPGNVEQLTKSILILLNINDIAKEMGLKGKNFVIENFTIQKVVEILEKVYEEVVKR
jgi:glycosyltransferase involved in cell wall biosynthesis